MVIPQNAIKLHAYLVYFFDGSSAIILLNPQELVDFLNWKSFVLHTYRLK